MSGQTYRLPAGTFFEVSDGLIVRMTAYCSSLGARGATVELTTHARNF